MLNSLSYNSIIIENVILSFWLSRLWINNSMRWMLPVYQQSWK